MKTLRIALLATLLPSRLAWHHLAFALIVMGLAAQSSRAQTPIKAIEPYYSRLQSLPNWAAFTGGGFYYKFSTSRPMPNQGTAGIVYSYNGTNYTDLTRVGDGQCVDLIKKVSGKAPG